MKNTSKDRGSLAREASYKSFSGIEWKKRSRQTNGSPASVQAFVVQWEEEHLGIFMKQHVQDLARKINPKRGSKKSSAKPYSGHSRRNWEAALWGWCFSRTVWMERGVSIGVLGYTMLPPPNFTFPVSLCYQSPIGRREYICLSFTIFLSAWCWRLDQLLWITSNISLSSRWLL